MMFLHLILDVHIQWTPNCCSNWMVFVDKRLGRGHCSYVQVIHVCKILVNLPLYNPWQNSMSIKEDSMAYPMMVLVSFLQGRHATHYSCSFTTYRIKHLLLTATALFYDHWKSNTRILRKDPVIHQGFKVHAWVQSRHAMVQGNSQNFALF
jgi:hypothetical protein